MMLVSKMEVYVVCHEHSSNRGVVCHEQQLVMPQHHNWTDPAANPNNHKLAGVHGGWSHMMLLS